MRPINLIPPDVRRAAAVRTRGARWALALALAFVSALVPYLLVLSRNAHTAALQEQLASLDRRAADLRTSLRAATLRAQQAQSQLERSRALRGKRSWSGLLFLLSTTLPPDCWLHSVSTDPETPPAGSNRPAAPAAAAQTNGATAPVPETVTIEAPRKLRLTGSSTNDAQPLVFVENLTESGIFSRVALQKALRSPGSEGRENPSYEFEIICEW